MSDHNNFIAHDILRDQAPALAARLNADRVGEISGRKILELYNHTLSYAVTDRDLSKTDDDVRELLGLMRTMLAESCLLDRLVTYEVDHARAQLGDKRGDEIDEAKENYILRMTAGCRERLHDRSHNADYACRRALLHLNPIDSSARVFLHELDSAVHDLKHSFHEHTQILTVLNQDDSMRFTDATRCRHDNETRAFMFEVINDAQQVADKIQEVLMRLDEKSASERREQEGPEHVATAIQRVAQGLGVSIPTPTPVPEQPKRMRGPRGHYDAERVKDALAGNEAVDIFSARQTESYRQRTGNTGGPGEGRS